MRKSKTNKCKCCNSALGTAASHLIFDDAGKERNIAFLLFDYIGKKVSESDGDQQAVCDNCLRQLIQCYEFKQKCVQANEDEDSGDDSNDEMEFNEIIEEESNDMGNLVMKPDQTAAENEYGFEKYVEFIEEYDDDDVDVEDEELTGVTNIEQTLTETENEYEFLNDFCGFVLTKDEDELNLADADEGQSLVAADIEYLDADVEDEGRYAFAENEESPEPDSEVIELAEFALDTNSKTVKTIGKFTFHFDFLSFESKQFPFIITDTLEDLHRIKEKLKQGVPRHMIELNRTMKPTAQSLDVEKIVTSDDLINILEADYHSENSYSRRVRDDADVFKIPKIESCEEIEYLEEEDSQVSIDEYLKSIAYIDYVENYSSSFYCKVSQPELAQNCTIRRNANRIDFCSCARRI